MKRTVYARLNKSQTCQDETGSWWVRYLDPHTGRWTKWVPNAGMPGQKPPGTRVEGKIIEVHLPIDQE